MRKKIVRKTKRKKLKLQKKDAKESSAKDCKE